MGIDVATLALVGDEIGSALLAVRVALRIERHARFGIAFRDIRERPENA